MLCSAIPHCHFGYPRCWREAGRRRGANRETGRPLAMNDLLIAIALCVAVAIAYATAALIQARHAHLTVRELAHVPVLWVALALNGLGAALHVTSLGFGPLSL